ncbi:Nucleotidyltransferase domain [Anaerotruncus sp. 2789STDY5834896]|uniref:Nucleotidyltransferase domain n=1 Tax=uncultured Anaerotruncus sp. TaxID=905011 RepID=A0A1C6K149_9FIRM|nr:Nucleotidyltransferase domain [uncultured Anaerotruncus sp.]
MQISEIINTITAALAPVAGIDAVVLGGSRATGTAGPGSDIDIGVYYTAALDLPAFSRAATALDDAHRPDCITGLGAWGPWINGGGWLTVGGVPVDILFRDTAQVARCIQDCIAGHITIDYQCGHPFGFVNAIYMGEVYHCRPLRQNTPALQQLKDQLRTFPPRYQKAAVEKFLWESDFSLTCGQKAIAKGDHLYAVGSLYRTANCLLQALYAAAGLYCLNEKGSLQRLLHSGAPVPSGLASALSAILTVDPQNIAPSFDMAAQLHRQVCALCARG